MSEQKPGQGNSDHLVVRLSLLSPRPITIIGRRRLIGEGGREEQGGGSSPFLPFLPATAKSSEEEEKERETDPILFPVQRKSEAREGRAEYVSTKGFFCMRRD